MHFKVVFGGGRGGACGRPGGAFGGPRSVLDGLVCYWQVSWVISVWSWAVVGERARGFWTDFGGLVGRLWGSLGRFGSAIGGVWEALGRLMGNLGRKLAISLSVWRAGGGGSRARRPGRQRAIFASGRFFLKIPPSI